MKLLSEEKYKHELHIVSADMPSTMDAAIEDIAVWKNCAFHVRSLIHSLASLIDVRQKNNHWNVF